MLKLQFTQKPCQSVRKGVPHTGIDFKASDVRRIDNPNSDKEDITDVHYSDGKYYVTFKAGTEQKAVEWKKSCRKSQILL